jgi:hypothetical protein
MEMTNIPRPTHEEFLESIGAGEKGHSGAGLLSHLRGVRDLLHAWGAREDLTTAGLYHSVYGTESYMRTTLDVSLREALRGQIGSAAEELVYLFGVMEKESFYRNLSAPPPYAIRCRLTGENIELASAQFADLCELTVANWLEQRPRAGERNRYLRADEFRAMRPLLSAAGRAALDDAYRF